MRIAQISPLIESVPPKLYGGTERIVSYLSEELVRQGHEVTLFASGDSETAAELVSCAPTALRLAQVTDAQPYTVMQLEKIRRRAGDFDIAHFHSDFFHFPLVRSLGTPSVTTLHGRLDLPFYRLLLDEFPEMPLVSISDDQRRMLSGAVGRDCAAWSSQRPLFVLGRRARADIWRSSAGSARKSALTGRSRSPSAPAFRSRSPPRSIRSTRPILTKRSVRSSKAWRRIYWRSQRQREAGFPRRRLGVAVSHRLARTVRSRPDRGHGLRNSGRRLAPRLRPGSDR